MHKKNILKYIIGFRSGNKYKKIISAIYYLFALIMFTEEVGYGLFLAAAPYLVFSFIDLIRHRKNAISFKKAIIPFALSFGVMSVAMAGVPEVESRETSQETVQEASQIQEQEIVAQEQQMAANEDNSESNETPTKVPKPTKAPEKTNGVLEVHYLDVGQGESILIKDPSGQSMLIDAGNNSDGNFICSYLKEQGISKVDVLVGTHPHADHIGGMDDVINNFDIGKIYMPKISHTSRTYEEVLIAIKNKGLRISTPEPAQTFSIGDAKLTILGPVKSYSDLNNNSIVLKMDYGNTSFVFTGDAENKAERDILNQGYNLSADVLNAGHHGSSTSTTNDFLRAVSPKYAVISAGTGNQYGHPSADTLSRLAGEGVSVYRTDESGTIIAKSDGKKITFNKNSSKVKVEEPKPTLTPTPKPEATPTPKPVEDTNDNKTEQVYITKTGAKYHKGSCSHLSKSKIAISLDNAKSRGYEPCSRCH